ncbi:uncharacterized protein LOC119094630 [Pollicipes pollicipes]|uniref:uncharacterized protein LOC119094630 n=1 Tax=Pollicipes pollicipes TaxID=41117 RepID=UPI001884B1DB|nr:uncharacterized protein LOC119094630 [Pollicipes pollicipes]
MLRRLSELERDGRPFLVHYFPGNKPYVVPAARLLRGRSLPTAVVYRCRGALCLRCCLPEGQAVDGRFSAAGWLRDVTAGVAAEPVSWADPLRTAGLDITARLTHQQEQALVADLLARLSERATAGLG